MTASASFIVFTKYRSSPIAQNDKALIKTENSGFARFHRNSTPSKVNGICRTTRSLMTTTVKYELLLMSIRN